MQQWKKDVIYGGAISIVSVFLIINTLGMDDSLMAHNAAKAGVYTRFWLYLLLLLGVLLIIKALMKRDTTPTDKVFNIASIVTIVSLAIYVFALEYLGFILCTIVYLILLMLYYTKKAGKFRTETGDRLSRKELIKTLGIIVVGSVAVTGITYVLFGEIIGLLLPEFKLW